MKVNSDNKLNLFYQMELKEKNQLESINESEDQANDLNQNKNYERYSNAERHLSLKLTANLKIKNPNKKVKIYLAEDVRKDLGDKNKYKEIIYPYIQGKERNKKELVKYSNTQGNKESQKNKKSTSVDYFNINKSNKKPDNKFGRFINDDIYKNYKYNFENDYKMNNFMRKSFSKKISDNIILTTTEKLRNGKPRLSKIHAKNYFNTPIISNINYISTNFNKESENINNSKELKSNKLVLKGLKDNKVKVIESLDLGEEENYILDNKFNKDESSSEIGDSSDSSEDENDLKNIHEFKDLKSFVLSYPGTSSGLAKQNQDNYMIIENNIFKQYNIYGVFDGHGLNGNLVSEFLKNKFKEFYLNKNNYSLKQNNEKYIDITKEEKIINFNHKKLAEMKELLLANEYEIIKRCIKEVEFELENVNYDVYFSGSTSNLLFLVGNTLICANTGDSRCVIFNSSFEDKWSFEFLSEDHKPTNLKEKKRIIKNGGEIHPSYDENGISEEIQRIWLPGKKYPGLSLSRSIGDIIAKNIGVTSEPDIKVKELDEDSRFIVLGTDGFWDMIKPYDVNRIVRPFYEKQDIKGGCRKLLDKVISLWKRDPSDRDDITILLIFLGNRNDKKKEKENSGEIILNLGNTNSGL